MLLSNEFEKFKKDCNFYFSRVLHKPLVQPDMLQIAPTQRCPLRCVMCDVFKHPSNPKEELTTNQFKKIINEASKWGIHEFFITGGEPFVRKDCLEITNYAAKKGLYTSISTSGFLIDDNLAKKIARSSLGTLTFSIDGLEKTHDHVRGKGVFEKAIHAIKMIQNYKNKIRKSKNDAPRINILSIVMNSNLEELMDLIKLAEKMKLEGIIFQPLVVDNTYMWKRDVRSSLMIPKSRLNYLFKTMDKIENYKKKTTLSYINIDTPLIKKYFKGTLNKTDMKCYAGYNRIFIKFNGDIGSTCVCNWGNIRHKSLKEIWHSKNGFDFRLMSKNCNKKCLQICSYRPESENFLKICQKFLKQIKMSNVKLKNKINLLNKGLIFIQNNEKILQASKYQILFSEKYKTIGQSKQDFNDIIDTLHEIEMAKLQFRKNLSEYGSNEKIN